jgi:purine nucleosidase
MLTKKKVIIDCDPGIDDALALMLALASEEIEIKAVTAVFGNADINQTYENILKIFSLCKVGKRPPIGKGAEVALDARPYKPRFVHGLDGLGNTNLKTVRIDKEPEEAKEVLKNQLKKEEIDTLIALGPLTNVARMLIEEPQVEEKIKQILVMGGAVYTSGNATKDAEFNIYQDPAAAKAVINSKIPIKLVSLDATRKILYTREILNKIKHKRDSELSDFIHQMLEFALDYHKKYRKRDGIYLPDVLAVESVLDEKIGKFKDLSLDVDIEKDVGRIFVNLEAENNVAFLEEVDTERAAELFIDRINKLVG